MLAEVVTRDAQSATLRVVTDRLAPLLPGSPPDVPPVVSFPNPDTDAPGTNELTRLYVASTATGTWGLMLPNTTAAQCGHTTHGTAWAACTSYPYTAAPGLCADWMED